MITCTLTLAAALLECPGLTAPVLIGRDTPAGNHIARPAGAAQAVHYADGGAGLVLALHPVWTPERATLLDQSPEHRRYVTDGCINLSRKDFTKLPKTRFRLIIK